jgi:hypothetical protein
MQAGVQDRELSATAPFQSRAFKRRTFSVLNSRTLSLRLYLTLSRKSLRCIFLPGFRILCTTVGPPEGTSTRR